MNCVHNELCVVRRECVRSSILGRMCTTLYLAPAESFRLPDGHESHGTKNRHGELWVVEFENFVKVPIGDGITITGYRLSKFGVVPDVALFPIRGGLTQAEVSDNPYRAAK